ncbi:MAG: FAD-dependent oxidoreductase [Bacteroidetes bacterium]|nr:FAD-dependent oxidoreductase [Bacteroidota bacterium]
MKKDVVIIGAGVSGLSTAIKLAMNQPKINIVVLAKKHFDDCNTSRAQGGIAAVMDKMNDNFQRHLDDTLETGGGLCNKRIAQLFVKESPKRIIELDEWGVEFTKDKKGDFLLNLEGGHSANRIVHAQDKTGQILLEGLINKAKSFSNIEILLHHFVTNIVLNENKECIGVKVVNLTENKLYAIFAKVIVLGSGGSGQVFENTTNPKEATGDGIVLANRIGAKISNMRFLQFHPTALYEPHNNPKFLISEAVRGYGAHIVNHKMQRFLFKHDVRGELATRDILTKAIFDEMKNENQDFVFLDLRHLVIEDFKQKFPTIFSYLAFSDYNIAKNLIPIIPAAHYQCGGIDTDVWGHTSIEGLFAVGECANNGLQGSNRLASNSLAESLVFADFIAQGILNKIKEKQMPVVEFEEKTLHNTQKTDAELTVMSQSLKRMMSKIISANTSKDEFQLASMLCLKIKHLTEEYTSFDLNREEIKNLAEVSEIIIADKISHSSFETESNNNHQLV